MNAEHRRTPIIEIPKKERHSEKTRQKDTKRAEIVTQIEQRNWKSIEHSGKRCYTDRVSIEIYREERATIEKKENAPIDKK